MTITSLISIITLTGNLGSSFHSSFFRDVECVYMMDDEKNGYHENIIESVMDFGI